MSGMVLAQPSVGFPLPQAQSEPDPAVIRAVLTYFMRNPRAMDSLEGVTRWRLLEEQVHRTLQQTEAALAFLVAQGFLEKVQTAGSTQIFRLDTKHQAAAARFLAKKTGRIGKKEI